MPRSSRLETHDHSTCGFMAWCRKSGAQVAGKLENPTARAWSLMPRDYGCCGTEKPAKRGEVESALRLGQRPNEWARFLGIVHVMYRHSHSLLGELW